MAMKGGIYRYAFTTWISLLSFAFAPPYRYRLAQAHPRSPLADLPTYDSAVPCKAQDLQP